MKLNGGVIHYAVIVRNENKDPSNLFTFIIFLVFVVIFESFWEREKQTDMKTRWNRVRDSIDPLITFIHLLFLVQ